MPLISRASVLEFEFDALNIATVHGHAVHSKGSKRKLRRVAVQIETADGLRGEYVPVWSAPPMAVGQMVAFAPRLLGHDIAEREQLWDAAHWFLRKGDRIGYGAFDVALWDAYGKALGQPIASLLGRFRDRLPTYASTIHGNEDDPTGLNTPKSYGDYARECARKFPAFKIHGFVTGRARDLVSIIEAVREAVGDGYPLMLDISQQLPTWADALTVGYACDAARLLWMEDPLRGNSIQGHKMLREKLKTPIFPTELVRELEAKIALALGGGTDFLRADPELDMGITGVMKTAHAAEAIGMDVEVHGAGPAQRHCVAAIRNTNYYEMNSLHPASGNPMVPPVYADDYSDEPEAVGEDGCVAVPAGPGLGVAYDWDFIDAHTTRVHRFGGEH